MATSRTFSLKSRNGCTTFRTSMYGPLPYCLPASPCITICGLHFMPAASAVSRIFKQFASALSTERHGYRPRSILKITMKRLLAPWLQLHITLQKQTHFFFASALIVPINLSLRVFLPFAFRNVPNGRPCFFSNEPTVQSDRVFLNIALPSSSLILKTTCSL